MKLGKRKKISFENDQTQKLQKVECPYLGQINRSALDFDFEKECSISLQKDLNIYCCLSCGAYFRGKGQGTEAFIHSLDKTGHNVFINLMDARIYCLPDNYEVHDTSLDDIKSYLRPTFTTEVTAAAPRKCIDGKEFVPGYVGLNSIKSLDYLNVVIQTLTKVDPIKDFCLKFGYDKINKMAMEGSSQICPKQRVLLSFIELCKKMWNQHNFKGHVSPHEFSQAVSTASKKKFCAGTQSDPITFIPWFFNQLMFCKIPKLTSLIRDTFQGQLKMESQIGNSTETKEVPFFFLALSIPTMPLFQDKSDYQKKQVIPQISLMELLSKYDGTKVTSDYSIKINLENRDKFDPKHVVDKGLKRKFSILKLPNYLILHVQRFVKNDFFVEKNPTIVNFDLENLDLSYLLPTADSGEAKYNLIANIIHEGNKPDNGVYKIQVRQEEKWFEIQDLQVKEVMAQQVKVSESYILVYKRN